MKNKAIEVTITKKHFDAAVKAEAASRKSIIETCLLAQAIKAAFPRKHVEVGNFSVTIGKEKADYNLDTKGVKLIERFDGGERSRKALLKILPTTFKLTLEAQA